MTVDLDIPADSPERPFLEYWAKNLLDPRDPQNARWLAYEMGQVDRGRRVADELAKSVEIAGRHVLDVGCQTGALAVALAERGANVTGIDVSEELARAATIRLECHGHTARFASGVAERLPFDAASFDVVTLIDVIEHVADHTRTLSECARVLRPHGLLYLQGPNRWSPRWFWKDPHYEMFGISVLPEWAGRFYVTRVRGRPRYDVGLFPVGSRIVRTLRETGMRILHAPVDASTRGLRARARGEVALRFGRLFTIVAEKQASGDESVPSVATSAAVSP